jgi:acyl-CoA hydrolase
VDENQREVALRFLAQPSDVNFGGKVHGGSVMKWIDQAGYACAVGWSRRYAVTVYVSGIRFYRPILVGHLVEVAARIIHTGRTSMHVLVTVSAGDPRKQVYEKATQCVIVFVALDEDQQPVEVPKWTPISAEDRALGEYAVKLMEASRGLEDELTRG